MYIYIYFFLQNENELFSKFLKWEKYVQRYFFHFFLENEGYCEFQASSVNMKVIMNFSLETRL